jgi:hypothetical protein
MRNRLVLSVTPGLIMALLLAPVGRATASDIDTILSALAQRKHGHVGFIEEKFVALLDKPVKSRGELLYDAPDRLEKRTLTPRPESLVLQKGVVTADRGRHHYVLDLRQYPQIVPFIESIRATLAGDRAALEHIFRLELEGTSDTWTLNLSPLDARVSKTVTLIRIDGAQAAIHRVEIFEADGDRSVLTIGADIHP